jgi:hypothetical protein
MAAPPTEPEPELTTIDSLPVEMLTEVLLRVDVPSGLLAAPSPGPQSRCRVRLQEEELAGSPLGDSTKQHS